MTTEAVAATDWIAERLGALLQIRDGRLYREQYVDFDTYCFARHGITRQNVEAMMVATGHPEAPASMSLLTALEIIGGARPRKRAVDMEPDPMSAAGRIPRLPDPEPTDLYRCFDAAGGLLYVGVSNDVFRRMDQHRMSAAWWPDMASVAVEHMPSRRSAEVAELSAIRSEHPTHNIMGA